MASLPQMLLTVGLFTLTLTLVAEASHFRGGTISWRPVDATQVEFYFKLGWSFGRGPGCTEQKIGQFVKDRSVGFWYCQQGCAKTETLSDTFYSCTAASVQEDWEQGEHKFNHTFVAPTEYSVGFSGSAWMLINGNKGNGPWNIGTKVDLRTRSDIGFANSSPYTLSKALYNAPFGCTTSLRIPVLDPNGDTIRCRWAAGHECGAVCNALPGAHLDEETCTITFTPNVTNGYQKNGMYAVALSIEDYPRTQVTLGGTVRKTPTDALSLVPLQFLIHTPAYPGTCESRPQWVDPTPADMEVIVVAVGHALSLPLYADNGNSTVPITGIQVIGPASLHQSRLQQDTGLQNTFYKTLTWNVTEKDIGEEIVCANPMDLTGKAGDSRCFTIKIEMDYCKPRPCLNGGVCTNVINDYSCACPSGYTGKNCTDVLVLPCSSKPCQNGGSCTNTNNTYSCTCAPGYTGKNCQDPDICSSGPCQNGGNCTNIINDYSCVCSRRYTGKDCSSKKGFGHCSSHLCENSAICLSSFHGYTCLCTNGWTGKYCGIPGGTSEIPTTETSENPTTQSSLNSTTNSSPSPTTHSTLVNSMQSSSIPTTQPSTLTTKYSTIIPTTQSSTTSTTQSTTTPTTQYTTIPTKQSATVPTTQSTTAPTTQSTTVPTIQSTTLPTTKSTTIPTTRPKTTLTPRVNPPIPPKVPQIPHARLSPLPPFPLTTPKPVQTRQLRPPPATRVNPLGTATVVYDEGGKCPCADSGGAHHGHPLEADTFVKDILIGLFGFLFGVACGLTLYFLIRRCMDRDRDRAPWTPRSSRVMDSWVKDPGSPRMTSLMMDNLSNDTFPANKVGIPPTTTSFSGKMGSRPSLNKLIDW